MSEIDGADEARRARVTECYKRYRDRIEHQDSLLHQRAGWIVGAQAFLLGTFPLLTNNPVLYIDPSQSRLTKVPEALSGLPALRDTLAALPVVLDNYYERFALVPGSAHLAFSVTRLMDTVDFLRGSFEVAGFLMAVLPLVSAVAAARAIRTLSSEYEHRVAQLTIGRAINKDNYADIRSALDIIGTEWGFPEIGTPTRLRFFALLAPMFKGIVFATVWILLWLIERGIDPWANYLTIGVAVLTIVSIGIYLARQGSRHV